MLRRYTELESITGRVIRCAIEFDSRTSGCPAGLLINFNEVLLKNGLRRLDRPDLYVKKV